MKYKKPRKYIFKSYDYIEPKDKDWKKLDLFNDTVRAKKKKIGR